MNLVGILFSNWRTVVLLLVSSSAGSMFAQIPEKTVSTEQTSFGMEEAFEHPMPLNEAAIRTLAADRAIADVLKDDQITDLSILQKWFTASEVHLGSSNEVGLVVMSIGIELGANTTQFRILRQNSDGYSIVLHTQALDLTVLDTRTNGLRDIQIGAVVGGYADFADFKFDSRAYQLVRRSSAPIGTELPHDLSRYETHKPFVQSKGQDEEPILAEARAWIWQHWQARKRSYLKVSTEDNDGEKQTCTYYIDNNSENKEWQVTIDAHRTVWDQDSPSGLRYMVMEDDITIAVQVQRTDPPVDDSDSARVLPDKEESPSAKYRLRFLGYGEWPVAKL